MAGRISGITIEINGETTKLQKSLKGLDSSLKNTQSKLKDIEKLLKLSPTSTELLTQKQKSLETAIGDTKKRLEELKDAQGSVAEGTEEWDSLQREIIATEQQLQSLESEYRNFGSVGAQQIAAIGEKMKDLGSKMSEVGETLTKYVTLPIVGAGTAAVKSFAEVDKTMQLTNATMGNTAEEAAMLNRAMEEAAANSTFGMSDAAEATLNFARAGLDAEQAAAALAPAMNLAAGEGGNLDTVSAGLVGTINGFGDSFAETAHYADVFAAACNNSALDVDSLSNAMSVAAPIFSTAGYSVEDAALYMGVMANNGIDANVAANSLKTGIARLVSPAKEGAEMMAQLGIAVTNADGSMKDSVQLQQELHDAFSQLSESEQIAAASAIFGKNQMAPWLALINTAPADVNELSDSLTNAAGTTDEMAEAMMGGFGGSIEKLKSSLDVLMTSLGRLIAEYLQPVINKVQEWVDKFNSLDDNTKKIIVTVAGIVAAIGPLLVIGGKLITGIGMLLTFAPMIATALGAISLPVIGITALIIALVAAGIYLVTHWEQVKAKAAEIWNSVKESAKQAWDGMVQAFETMKQSMSEKVENLKQKLVETWNNIKQTAINSFNGLKTSVSTIWDSIRESISSRIEAAKDTVRNAIEAIKGFLSEHLSFPHISLPHFSWTWSDLGVIKIPHISVEWYKKAYDNPYMFTSPTVIGNRGFGDGNGAEMVYGRDNLMQDIKDAMASVTNDQPIRITVQSVLDGKIIGQSVTSYQRGLARAMG